jgi:hypothetical protein
MVPFVANYDVQWIILNACSTSNIFNLRWVYWDISHRKSSHICICLECFFLKLVLEERFKQKNNKAELYMSFLCAL